jgi:hypothetical protein
LCKVRQVFQNNGPDDLPSFAPSKKNKPYEIKNSLLTVYDRSACSSGFWPGAAGTRRRSV